MKKYLIVSNALLVLFLTRVNCQVIIDSTNINYHAQSSYIAEILHDFKVIDLKEIKSYKISENHISPEYVISFLNSDFKTDIFNQFNFLRASNFEIISKGKALHLGIIELGFNTSSELEKAYKIVKCVNRNNFNLQVLTEFILVKKKENLIFLFSETSYDPLIISFFDRIKKIYTSNN